MFSSVGRGLAVFIFDTDEKLEECSEVGLDSRLSIFVRFSEPLTHVTSEDEDHQQSIVRTAHCRRSERERERAVDDLKNPSKSKDRSVRRLVLHSLLLNRSLTIIDTKESEGSSGFYRGTGCLALCMVTGFSDVRPLRP